jgi:hypothetical protein
MVMLYFPKNSYLVESFNKKLETFVTAGLIQFWASVHTNMKYQLLKFTNTESIWNNSDFDRRISYINNGFCW